MAACSPPPSGNDGGGGGSGGAGGNNAGGGNGSGGGYASVDAFCADAPNKFCAWEVRCGQASSQSECVTFTQRIGLFAECGLEEKAAIKDGRAGFDGVAGQRCLDGLAAAACTKGQGFLDTNADCLATFPGKVATGGSCYAQLECALTDYCTSTGASCPGTCAARKAAGASTSTKDARECQAGLYNYDGVKCLAPVQSGGNCAPISPSTQDQRCALGLYCANGTCAAQLSSGSACSDDGDCSAFLVCQNGVCGAYRTLGQGCDGNPSIQCTVDLHCDFPTFTGSGTCQTAAQQGGGCWVSGDCAQGLYCAGYDFTNQIRGSCQPRKQAGAACTTGGDPFQCDDALYCGGGSCVVRKPQGAGCATDAECANHLYCAGTCQPAACFDPTP